MAGRKVCDASAPSASGKISSCMRVADGAYTAKVTPACDGYAPRGQFAVGHEVGSSGITMPLILAKSGNQVP